MSVGMMINLSIVNRPPWGGFFCAKKELKMAKNDYFVIVYKILSYLYECMKAGKEPAQEDIACDSQLFHISQRYWNHIKMEC